MECCLCGREIEVVNGWAEGHNAQPAADGRCCGDCNAAIVVPKRLLEMMIRQNWAKK